MKTLSIGIIFGLFGAVAVSISFAMQWPTWGLFIAWVSYYIFGKTLKSSAASFMQIALGFTMGIMMIESLKLRLKGFFLPGSV